MTDYQIRTAAIVFVIFLILAFIGIQMDEDRALERKYLETGYCQVWERHDLDRTGNNVAWVSNWVKCSAAEANGGR